MNVILIVLGAFLLAGHPAYAEYTTAAIKGTAENSELFGTATFRETPEGLTIEVEVFGAPPGLHGIHIHEHGSCEDGGNAAGGHFNPSGVAHGFLPKDGFEKAHAGDLGNLEVPSDGHGLLTLVIQDLKVREGPYHVSGKAIILHENADDFGQPTGNAGGRIACGTIG